MTRHIGAFIQNTILPLIDRSEVLISKLEELCRKYPKAMDKLDLLVEMELEKVFMYCLTATGISVLLFFAWIFR